MMVYDQLNLPGLAPAEALNRRRALIEHAHSGRPDTPSYEGAEDFMGIKDTADGSLVDPALLQFTAKRQAAKAEIMKQSRLAAEERKAAHKKGDGKGDKDKESRGALETPTYSRARAHGPGQGPETFLGAKQFSKEPLGHHGDIFPMPLPMDRGFPGSSAVLETQLSSMEASSIGRWDERWRFRREDGAQVEVFSRAEVKKANDRLTSPARADKAWRERSRSRPSFEALEFFRPEAARAGELRLPHFKKAMKGWRRLAPTQTRMPMVEFAKTCISGLMMSQGWHEMALYNEVTYSTYARPGEMLRVMAVDVAPKNSQFNHHVIVLSPFERGVSSKTGIFDEVLVMDDVRMPQLGDLLVEWARRRMNKEGEEAKRWSFNLQPFGEMIRRDFPKWFRGGSFPVPAQLQRRLGDHFKI
ncbi:unnamed protein product [Durusdinium trenchii]